MKVTIIFVMFSDKILIVVINYQNSQKFKDFNIRRAAQLKSPAGPSLAGLFDRGGIINIYFSATSRKAAGSFFSPFSITSKCRCASCLNSAPSGSETVPIWSPRFTLSPFFRPSLTLI